MPQRPSRVIRSSELKASRGKSRPSLRGEIDDIRSALTKTDEEARRKQAFYDAVKFYRKVNFYGDVTIQNDDGTLATFRAPFGATPDNSIAFSANVTFNEQVAFGTPTAVDSIQSVFGLVESDVWTPTLTNVTNLTASTAYECHYIRINDKVICFGRFDADVTAVAPTSTELGISLPIASALTSSAQLGGTASTSRDGGLIIADTTNDRASVQWSAAVNSANAGWGFMFGYTIL